MHTTDTLRSAGRQIAAAKSPSYSLLPASLLLPKPGAPQALQQRQPRGRSALQAQQQSLLILCAVEILAGFALQALSAVLVLFLCERAGYSQSHALRFVGTFSGLCYLGPLVGGWLADRVLGFRWAVLAGAAVLCAGFSMLARSTSLSFAAVGLLVLGSTLFRSNIVALSGRICTATTTREAAYRRLYIAFNFGAALAPPIAACLHLRYGWAAPFAACALAMACAVLLTACAHARLKFADRSTRENPRDEPTPVAPRWRTILLLLTVMALWAVCVGQSDGALLLWARDHVRRGLLGFEVPAAAFASLPALLTLLLSPIVGVFQRLSATRPARSRISIGMASTALAMGLMALASIVTGNSPSSAAWLIGCFVLLIFGELLVAPLTQAILSHLAPHSRHGLVLSASYGAIAVGYGLAGAVGTLWTRWPKPAFFGLLACAALFGVLLLKLEGRSEVFE